MKVLIAVEESECSRRALESVMERSWPEESQFRIINVFEPIPAYGEVMYSPRAAESMVAAEQELLEAKKKRLKESIATLKEHVPACPVSGSILTGDIRNSILDEAKNWGADLIVLGSHGRKGLSKLFLGSVAEGVAGHADCSVEIVKQRAH
jgi:nucleotide-binding universal stress UspA family protein